ncbi:hypothetical protein BJV78DRAFT_1237393 [Lactifluus subvellereus]|nr:hypothetical protein BJV78DRAFT_1237393 [Lactifluus subvellereus]
MRSSPTPTVLALENPVVASLITSHARISDLPSLCLTTKSLSAAATRRLYYSLVLTNPSSAFLACETVANTPHVAAHVRGLVLGRGAPPVWRALQRALESLPHLEALALDARGVQLSWVFPCTPSFHLRDLRLGIPWDAQVAAFVRTQPSLRALWVLELAANYSPRANSEPQSRTSTGASGTGEAQEAAQTDATELDTDTDTMMDLPLLATVECPLRIAHAFVCSPLTHLQVLGEATAAASAIGQAASDDARLRHLILRLARARATLRSLSLHDVSEARTGDTIALVAQHCPQLRYLGTLPLPSGPRTAVHDALIRFEALVALEFELSTWVPLPSGALQRTLVTELHMFCPSLRNVSLWISSRRFVWRYDAEVDVWGGQVDQRGISGWKSV